MFPPPKKKRVDDDLCFDREAIRQVAAAHGHKLCLCQRMIVHATDFGRGIPQKESMVCTDQILGYISEKSMAQISINPSGGESGIIRVTDALANLIPDEYFNSSVITKDSRLLFMGIYYQMTLINEPANTDRGYVQLCQYRLHNPDKAILEGQQPRPKMVTAKEFFDKNKKTRP